MGNDNDDEVLTVEEAARELKLSTHTIRRGYMGGHLKVQRLGLGGRIVRIVRRELHVWRDAGANTALPAEHYR
jgi:excisionase family DNA binding protein